MNAQEAEAAYRMAKSQLDYGQIGLDEFNRRIAELKYQDNTGTWWAISPADGSWLKWTGSAWVPAFAQAPEQPVQPSEKPSWYIPPVSSGQQKQAAAQPATAPPVQQPAAHPVASSYYIPPAGSVQQPVIPQQGRPAVQPATPAVKLARNWAGIGSLILGILSWILYPYLLGFAAIIVGGYSVYTIKKTTGKIAFVAIAGVLIGLASILVDNFYLFLFPLNIDDPPLTLKTIYLFFVF